MASDTTWKRTATVIGRTANGKAFASYNALGGHSVKVMDAGVYRKASEAAGRALRQGAEGRQPRPKSKKS